MSKLQHALKILTFLSIFLFLKNSYPQAYKEHPENVLYTVTEDMDLKTLSQKLYGTDKYWEEIARFNNIGFPYRIYASQQFRLKRSPIKEIKFIQNTKTQELVWNEKSGDNELLKLSDQSFVGDLVVEPDPIQRGFSLGSTTQLLSGAGTNTLVESKGSIAKPSALLPFLLGVEYSSSLFSVKTLRFSSRFLHAIRPPTYSRSHANFSSFEAGFESYLTPKERSPLPNLGLGLKFLYQPSYFLNLDTKSFSNGNMVSALGEFTLYWPRFLSILDFKVNGGFGFPSYLATRRATLLKFGGDLGIELIPLRKLRASYQYTQSSSSNKALASSLFLLGLEFHFPKRSEF